jgi:hypothetical protein
MKSASEWFDSLPHTSGGREIPHGDAIVQRNDILAIQIDAPKEADRMSSTCGGSRQRISSIITRLEAVDNGT